MPPEVRAAFERATAAVPMPSDDAPEAEWEAWATWTRSRWCSLSGQSRIQIGGGSTYCPVSYTHLLILVLVCLGGGVYMWTDEAPLRQQGVAAIARVVSVEDDAALVEFPDRQGRSVQAYLDSFGTPAVGEAVEVIYDPSDPEHVVLADEFRSPLGYVLLGASIIALLVLAALTWTCLLYTSRCV